MARFDESALICDMAETYHVYDWRALPVKLAATLAAGLRENSRIKTKLAGATLPLETMLMANVADCLRILVWRQTEDGFKGRNAPSLYMEMLHKDAAQSSGEGFESAEDFMAWREKMIGGEACG